MTETGVGRGCRENKGQTWLVERVGMGLENLQLIPRAIKCYSRSLSVPEGPGPGFVQGLSQEWDRLGTCGGCMETHHLLGNFALASAQVWAPTQGSPHPHTLRAVRLSQGQG